MATLNLPQFARQQGRRRNITLRPIQPTAARATELAAIMVEAATIWREAAERILAGYDPTPLTTGDSLTLDSISDIERAIAGVASDFLTRLVTTITPSLSRWAVRTEVWHRSKWSAAVAAGTGVDLSTVLTALPVQETLESWLARNVALIRNVSDQAQQRIADAVFRGYQQRMAEAGIELWKYRSSHKLHPRSWHAARDGRIYTLGTNEQVNPDGSPMKGGDVIEPGDGPSEPPWCGCRRQAYLAIQAELENA